MLKIKINELSFINLFWQHKKIIVTSSINKERINTADFGGCY
jgi:hypothetical protein